jgi:hypothetical protein
MKPRRRPLKSEPSIEPAPDRLIEQNGAAGELLRAAERIYQTAGSEVDAWQKVMKRSHRGTVAFLVSLAFAAAVASALGTSNLLRQMKGSATFQVEADRPSLQVTEPAPRLPEERPAVLAAPLQAPAALPRSSALRSPAPAPTDESGCRSLAGSVAGVDRAVECFRRIGQGSTLASELALYEGAKLAFEHHREPRRILTWLDDYKRRFPDGTMRGEVEWLRVQLLQRAGRVADALAESEVMLGTPVGRSLAPQLHMLRGRIFQDNRNDCASAASEFVALVGEPGNAGDEAELRRAECLQKLGRTTDAAAAYAQYLRRVNPLQGARAREQLTALRGSTEAGGE